MLELKNIKYSIIDKKHKTDIIKDISLHIKPGELIVITGPNGSGKSTLAEIIAGIKKPSSGHIFFTSKSSKKQDITNLSITERARQGISYSFQQPVRFKGVTVRDLLQVALTSEEALVAIDDLAIAKLLKDVGLEPVEYLDREVDSSLSGGELKRIEIASVLARQAKLTVFDEPEAGIDIWSFDNLIKIFRKMRKDIKDSSIVVISHQRKIMEIADKIILIDNGKIAKTGPADKMLREIEGKNK
ncbi:ATP-binding cassette domain-containing protein [Candidatus Saccharibacteria bacterium]|nr:ATP-binding cassette domain-containing protein [Candidatus Saccharibacteria bacterium]